MRSMHHASGIIKIKYTISVDKKFSIMHMLDNPYKQDF